MKFVVILMAVTVLFAVTVAFPLEDGDGQDREILGDRLLPPDYMFVDGYEDCLSSNKDGKQSSKCLPSSQPGSCSLVAWDKLNKLKDDGTLVLKECPQKNEGEETSCFVDGIAYNDGHIRGDPMEFLGIVATAKECQVKCQQNDECNFFTWRTNDYPRKPNSCWLKTAKGTEKINPGKVSGPKVCPSSTPAAEENAACPEENYACPAYVTFFGHGYHKGCEEGTTASIWLLGEYHCRKSCGLC